MADTDELLVIYEKVVQGAERPELGIVLSERGPLVITRARCYLTDADGTPLEVVSREWAVEQLRKLTSTT